MSSRAAWALAALTLFGCDRKGTDLLPDNSVFESVSTIGELGVMTPQDYWSFRNADDPQAWCSDNVDENGSHRCFYGQLGMPDAGVRGGASYTFTVPTVVAVPGVEEEPEPIENLCVVVDPETVFWNHSMAQLERETKPLIPDFHDDDGDLDLFVGLSSYYTGSPGVELGDFRGFYTDSLGRTIEIEYGECEQRGQTFGEHHAGRGALEYCDIDVEGREGVQFTVVMETFSVPLNDGALGYGTFVFAGDCDELVATPGEELVVPEESMVADKVAAGDGELPDYATLTCTYNLEVAVAGELQQEFCCVHPEMCSDRAPEDACDGFTETYDPETGDLFQAAENFCQNTLYSSLSPDAEYGNRADDTKSSLCCTDPDFSLIDVGGLGDADSTSDYYRVITATIPPAP